MLLHFVTAFFDSAMFCGLYNNFCTYWLPVMPCFSFLSHFVRVCHSSGFHLWVFGSYISGSLLLIIFSVLAFLVNVCFDHMFFIPCLSYRPWFANLFIQKGEYFGKVVLVHDLQNNLQEVSCIRSSVQEDNGVFNHERRRFNITQLIFVIIFSWRSKSWCSVW